MPVKIRKSLLTLNNCIYFFGRYLEAFKPGFTYSLTRVTSTEDNEIPDLSKEEILKDPAYIEEELTKLGVLFTSQSTPVADNKNVKKDLAFLTLVSELNSLDEKVRTVCAKVYVGEHAKLLANNEKMPNSLSQYLQSTKEELLNFKMNNTRVLRTISQNLFNLSLKIGKVVYEYIFTNSIFERNDSFKSIEANFELAQNDNEKIKSKISNQLRPYLVNPLYVKELNEIIETQKSRHDKFLDSTYQTQIKLLFELERQADGFVRRFANNFEALLLVFDNFIYEEEYVDLGDMDDFKDRKDYNFLLKLKEYNKEVNLDSKRSIKKIFIGLDKNKVKINYLERFPEIAKQVHEGIEERLKILSTEYSKQNPTRSVNAYRLPNNINLMSERNSYYEQYASKFIEEANRIIDFYNKTKEEEDNYTKSWETILRKIK